MLPQITTITAAYSSLDLNNERAAELREALEHLAALIRVFAARGGE